MSDQKVKTEDKLDECCKNKFIDISDIIDTIGTIDKDVLRIIKI